MEGDCAWIPTESKMGAAKTGRIIAVRDSCSPGGALEVGAHCSVASQYDLEAALLHLEDETGMSQAVVAPDLV